MSTVILTLLTYVKPVILSFANQDGTVILMLLNWYFGNFL